MRAAVTKIVGALHSGRYVTTPLMETSIHAWPDPVAGRSATNQSSPPIDEYLPGYPALQQASESTDHIRQ